jgi:hypothetical protein
MFRVRVFSKVIQTEKFSLLRCKSCWNLQFAHSTFTQGVNLYLSYQQSDCCCCDEMGFTNANDHLVAASPKMTLGSRVIDATNKFIKVLLHLFHAFTVACSSALVSCQNLPKSSLNCTLCVHLHQFLCLLREMFLEQVLSDWIFCTVFIVSQFNRIYLVGF